MTDQQGISTQEILNVAKLARLGLDESQAELYAKDLSKILAMMDILSDVNTDHLDPLTNVHDGVQVLRTDLAHADIDRNANQSVAPHVQDGLYLVPQVIE